MSGGWFATGAVMAAVGVVLGAFGAHGLRDRLTPDLLEIFETGVRYHLVHALGLLAVGWAVTRWSNGWTTAAGWLLLIGILVFSGSLYVLAISGLRWLGAITPIGGVAFILGWIALAIGALRG